MAALARWAFLCSPHTGGIWTVYKQLHKGLALHNIDLHWLSVGHQQDSAEANEFPGHVVSRGDSHVATAKECLRYIQNEQFNGVAINVLTSQLEMNLARYLPSQVKRILIVHNMTPATYLAAAGIHDWVHATVGVSPRIASTLVRRYGFCSGSTKCIPNAIEMSELSLTRKPTDATLRLLFLGRIVDTDKGVFWLPKILRHLTDLDVTLTVAGDGPDLSKLRKLCERYANKVKFLGRVSAEKVPMVVAEHDVMLMTSRFEGLPMALIECMALGCVPVASRIRGVTDFVVQDGKTGLLFPMGNTKAAARCIQALVADRSMLQQMAVAACEDVRYRFDSMEMGNKYAEVIELCNKSSLPTAFLSLENWTYPTSFNPGIRRLVPKLLKNILRKYLA